MNIGKKMKQDALARAAKGISCGYKLFARIANVFHFSQFHEKYIKVKR